MSSAAPSADPSTTSSADPLRDEILAALSTERVLRDARYFAEECPHRLSGTEMERKAAAYIKSQFDEVGIPMELHELDGYVSFPGKARIEVLDAQGAVLRTIEANTFAQSVQTPPEGLEAELVHVGPGGYDDYEGVEAAGKITLSELSYAPPRPEKVRIATELGSIGQIMMNWGLPEHETLPMGTCKPMWGNPTQKNFADLPQIPAVGIRLQDGLWLAEACRKGPVTIRLHSEVENRWGKIIQPMAWLEGSEEPEKFVIVGGHYDAWGPAASDNAAGNSEVIEIARVLAQHKGKLKRSVLFAFWAAHESGIMEGSSWFVDKFWDKLDRGGILYLNVDSVAMQDATHFQATASYQVAQFHRDLCKELLGIDNVKTTPVARTGDMSFFGVGVPAMYASHKHSPEQQKAWRGATLGWWYHSTLDTMERVDPALLKDSLMMHAAYTYELINRPTLPFEIADFTAQVKDRAEALAAFGDMGLEIGGLVTLATTLNEKAGQLKQRGAEIADEGSPEACIAFNDLVLKLSRQLTSVASTVSGRWDQDTYGLTALKTALPGLYGIEKLAKLDPEEAAYKLQWTELLRQRNRACDGLREATATLDAFLGTRPVPAA
ncbi:M28 family peptidase [Pseudooceanicola sp. 502str34]